MGIEQDIEEALKEMHVKKIDRRPMDEDLNTLMHKLSAIAVIPHCMEEDCMDMME